MHVTAVEFLLAVTGEDDEKGFFLDLNCAAFDDEEKRAGVTIAVQVPDPLSPEPVLVEFQEFPDEPSATGVRLHEQDYSLIFMAA
eukprot:6356441-Pyramimonas_sp.AAC.1